MQRLYLQFYVTILVALAVFVVDLVRKGRAQRKVAQPG